MENEFNKWLEEHNMKWTDKLPYSGLEGWTNGVFSVIYEGDKTESLESIKRRYYFAIEWQ